MLRRFVNTGVAISKSASSKSACTGFIPIARFLAQPQRQLSMHAHATRVQTPAVASVSRLVQRSKTPILANVLGGSLRHKHNQKRLLSNGAGAGGVPPQGQGRVWRDPNGVCFCCCAWFRLLLVFCVPWCSLCFHMTLTHVHTPTHTAVPVGETLAKYAVDLTQQAKDGKLDPVIGREV